MISNPRQVLVLNGPNLDLLGTRQPEVYGKSTLIDLADQLRTWGRDLGLGIEHFQSNHEGELVERIHSARGQFDGVVINAGALTHYSYALQDAIEAVAVPTVEVHISNVLEREAWRRHSVIAPVAVYSIYGRGLEGYRWALRHLRHRWASPFQTLSYGSYPDQVGDFRHTGGDGGPLAVLVHGGMWRHQWTRDTTESWAVELLERGWSTFNVEYRRVGTGGGWPQSFDDLHAAYEFASSLSSVDPARIAVAGHSAGGAMALWLAGEKTSKPPLWVVSVAGITDLVAAHQSRVGDGAIDDALGRRSLDPALTSPLHRLPTGTPTRLISCLDDTLISPDYAREYAKAAQANGDAVELTEVAASHMAVIESDTDAHRAVLDAITTPFG